MEEQGPKQTAEDKRRLIKEALCAFEEVDDNGAVISEARSIVRQLAADYYRDMMKAKYASMALTMNSLRDASAEDVIFISHNKCHHRWNR